LAKVLIIVGTRPEIIKQAPVIEEAKRQGLDFLFVTTGQHYDYGLCMRFIEEMGLPPPDYSLHLVKRDPIEQMGEMMVGLKKIVEGERDPLLLVEGDTNTVAATAIVGRKLSLTVGHVEAGLRSFDWRMPEEHNRIMVDHLADILFAPTEPSRQNLLRERVHGNIHVTGNTIIDAAIRNTPLAVKQSKIRNRIRFEKYVLATAHRAENVDDAAVLANLVEAMIDSPLPVVFPVHPRTDKMLKRFALRTRLERSKNVQLLPPLGYFDFLVLLKNCSLAITDSGGIQEEATAPPIRKPVLVLRVSTERPEAVKFGFAKVVGVQRDSILRGIRYAIRQNTVPEGKSPFGDGRAGRRIVDSLLTYRRPLAYPVGLEKAKLGLRATPSGS